MKIQVPRLSCRHPIYTLHRVAVVGNPAYLTPPHTAIFQRVLDNPQVILSLPPAGLVPVRGRLSLLKSALSLYILLANPCFTSFSYARHLIFTIRALIFFFFVFRVSTNYRYPCLPPNRCIATNTRPIISIPILFTKLFFYFLCVFVTRAAVL
ncbi:hypothetical protein F5148DRAFT_773531 [Russula earlei]|uniref:Uncharacterized protein n=1 Tax=Russula earlei TaxID=71964 RepID=A0ACC0UCT3_9AGAM|nr:hypothetical protein F5148DRAFT_773531 [Russula earlei]